jgi:L-asparaginase II
VQRTILENVARFTGLEQHEIVLGLDGCGVPCFGISVSHMALAFARLMDPPGDLPGEYRDAAAEVRGAMMDQPYLVAGRDRVDTDLMRTLHGAVSKEGAGGVQCIGLPGGIGLAVKMEAGAGSPGSGGPAAVAALEALRQLGALDDAALRALGRHTLPEVRSVAGEHVGNARAAFELGAGGGRRS